MAIQGAGGSSHPKAQKVKSGGMGGDISMEFRGAMLAKNGANGSADDVFKRPKSEGNVVGFAKGGPAGGARVTMRS